MKRSWLVWLLMEVTADERLIRKDEAPSFPAGPRLE
jgi:hypothetical protein